MSKRKYLIMDSLGHTDKDYDDHCERNGHIFGTPHPVFAYIENDDGSPIEYPINKVGDIDIKGKSIWVCDEYDNREVPHFHVCRNPVCMTYGIEVLGTQISTSIMIGEARYLPHHNHTETLNDIEIKSLVEMLDKHPRDDRPWTFWQSIIDLWNHNAWGYGNYYELDVNMPRPRYENGIL
jgi:hypothetical protein